jgi:cellobiose phosphorylase
MVLVPAALVHGLLGVQMSWREIKVKPAMPAEWEDAKASVVWKGRVYDLAIRGQSVAIAPRR